MQVFQKKAELLIANLSLYITNVKILFSLKVKFVFLYLFAFFFFFVGWGTRWRIFTISLEDPVKFTQLSADFSLLFLWFLLIKRVWGVPGWHSWLRIQCAGCGAGFTYCVGSSLAGNFHVLQVQIKKFIIV